MCPVFSFIPLNSYLSPPVLFWCIFCSLSAYSRSSHQMCSLKEMFFNILQNSQKKTCARVFFNKVAGKSSWFQFYEIETPAQLFSCGFCENFKDILLKKASMRPLLNRIVSTKKIKFKRSFSFLLRINFVNT